MEFVLAPAGAWSTTAAYVALSGIVISAAALFTLHVASPEFAPSWRMVSEYANGKWGLLLFVVFAGWAVSSFALMAALWPVTSMTLGKFALLFLFLAGVGQIMGGVFDINHKLHGPAAMVGIPSLCIAAVLTTLVLAKFEGITAPPTWSAHLPWISFALMIAAFMLFFSALKSAGVDMSSQTGPLKELPTGVTGYVGWANRLIFAASFLWTGLSALSVLRASPN